MQNYYLEDLKDHLRETPPMVFEAANTTADKIMADESVMDRLWTLYQKSVEDYDCDPDWSYRDALKEVLGIVLPEQYAVGI